MRKLIWLSLFLLATASLSASPTHYRVDAARTGVSSETGPRFFENLVWQRALQGPVPGLVHDGGVLYAGAFGGVYAIAPATGADLWVFAQPGVQFSPVAIDGNTVYVSGGNVFYALDRTTGALLWSFAAAGDISRSAPLIEDGTAFVGSAAGTVHAIDLASHAQDWSVSTGSPVTSHLTAVKKLVIVPTTTELLALRMSDGDERWSVAGTDWGAAATDGKDVYAGAADGFHALKATNGHSEWVFVDPDNAFTGGWSAPVVRNGIVSSGNGNMFVYGLDAASGARIWIEAVDQPPSDAIAGANGLMYFGVATTGSPSLTMVWSIEVDTGIPSSQRFVYGQVPGGVAIAGGVMFAHDSSGTLSAFSD